MTEREIPHLVAREINGAVASAIQFGVSAETFLALVRQAWRGELLEKQKSDDAVFARGNP